MDGAGTDFNLDSVCVAPNNGGRGKYSILASIHYYSTYCCVEKRNTTVDASSSWKCKIQEYTVRRSTGTVHLLRNRICTTPYRSRKVRGSVYLVLLHCSIVLVRSMYSTRVLAVQYVGEYYSTTVLYQRYFEKICDKRRGICGLT